MSSNLTVDNNLTVVGEINGSKASIADIISTTITSGDVSTNNNTTVNATITNIYGPPANVGGEVVVQVWDNIVHHGWSDFYGEAAFGSNVYVNSTFSVITTDDPNPPTIHAEITKTKATFNMPVQFGQYTTAERDAFVGVAFGTVIYNTTTNTFQGYQNTGGTTPQWVNLS